MWRKFKEKCHYCHKVGHMTVECRGKIREEKTQENLTEEDIPVVVTEVNMVEINNPKEWWYDTGATTHIFTDSVVFITYQKSKTHEKMFMGTMQSPRLKVRQGDSEDDI